MYRIIISITLVMLGLTGLCAQAQSLTQQQRTALAADIAADPALAALKAQGNLGGLAGAYNMQAVPGWTAWRTAVPIDDIMRNGMDWARVDNLSNGKARIWDWMGRLGALDCSKPNVRAGIDATWVGTAADLAVRATVYVHCKRTTTRFERLFSSGAGSDAEPATFGVDATGATIQGPVGATVFEEL